MRDTNKSAPQEATGDILTTHDKPNEYKPFCCGLQTMSLLRHRLVANHRPDSPGLFGQFKRSSQVGLEESLRCSESCVNDGIATVDQCRGLSIVGGPCKEGLCASV